MANLVEEYFDVIRKDPDNDEPRLVLADWYEEQGDLDRANLIRLQVERARLPRWEAECVHLELKERALLYKNRKSWDQALPQHEGVRWGRYQRGFPGKVAFDDVKIAMDVAAECVAAVPLRGVVMRWPRLKDRPELGALDGVRELTIVGTQMNAQDMEWLAQSEILSTVRELNLVRTRMTLEGLEKLLESPWLNQLEALRMPYHSLTNDGVDRLVQAEMPVLKDLDLSVPTEDECGSGGRYEETMDDMAVAALANWSAFAQLESLSLSGNQILQNGVRTLLASPSAKNLKCLKIKSVADWDYEESDGKPDVIVAFADAVEGIQLEELDVGENTLEGDNGKALINSPALAQLKVLHLDYTPMMSAELFAAPWFDEVRVLTASDGCGYLTTIMEREPKNLHTLILPSNYGWSRSDSLGGDLASGTPMPSLLVLDLRESGFDDAQLKKLGSAKTFPNLVELRVSDDWEQFTKEGAAAFADTPLAKQVVSLKIGYENDKLPYEELVYVGEGAVPGDLGHI